MKQPTLFDLSESDPASSPTATASSAPPPPDQAAREFAVDPANDVVLEASAGTGKTRVLVDRYVRLIEAGVDPRHILAITFTRKAAAEMRDRVLASLHRRADQRAFTPARWRELRDRIADIQISTIDAFCFGLLREFPLEADVDPAFEIADETEMARFANEALDLTMRAARGLVIDDERVRLLFARVKLPILRDALGTLLDRRHVAQPAVDSFVRDHRGPATAADAGAAFVARVRELLAAAPGRAAIVDDGPVRVPEFRWLHGDLTALDRIDAGNPARVQQFRRRIERYFLTKQGEPRKKLTRPYTPDQFSSADAKRRHEQALQAIAPALKTALDELDRDVNGLLARGLQRVLAIAVRIYEELLEEHALLDFAGMLERAVTLLTRQEEFARSRLKLQSRYHHVLVDEFQDTSRLQWRLVDLLIEAWGEGAGAADAPMSIFVVGDRKQSIYRFRHAEVTLLDEAARRIAALRPGRAVRQAISTSFRAVPELLAFVNALASEMPGEASLPERFDYRDEDRFPVAAVAPGARRDGEPVLGIIAQPTIAACASAAAEEVARLLASPTATVRDKIGPPRRPRPEDIAILFRARTGHRYFEEALETRGIRTYVYKGLGFFDAPEVQDLQALLRYLAQPESSLRAAEFLRSRFVRLSDVALAILAEKASGGFFATVAENEKATRRHFAVFAHVLRAPKLDLDGLGLDPIDRALLERAREGVARWLAAADRVTPSELLDQVLRESAYAFEMRGRRLDQARENVKKARALVRRVENRGYATIGRLAAYFETLRAGDESNAILEAAGAVNLMTMHAAKGLEFPIVFLVNLHMPGRGRPAGFSVIDRGPTGEPEVAFNPGPATELEDRRDNEELRRLLYVAVTRARDRLYVAGELDDKSRLRRGSRSLASLLPLGFHDLFAAAAAAADGAEVEWTSISGRFAWRVCRPPASTVRAAVVPSAIDPASIDVTPIRTESRRHQLPATAAVGPPVARPHSSMPWSVDAVDRLTGALVHRLFQCRADHTSPREVLASLASQLVRPEELVDVADSRTLVAEAVDLFVALRGREDLERLLRQGDVFYEVPFSWAPADRPDELFRGQVDCLVLGEDGRGTVLEFKTGAPRPEHAAQARIYASAVASALEIAQIDVQILYSR
ncbi:MAG TPA: UvrD-helicase domain-containing protein [Vicinamibacterales bacterium]|nr:UvrD-helicase domain-containing protein [Vicinamibacterales bacterium]